MDTLTLLRGFLPLISIGIFILIAKLTRAPRYVILSALEVCAIAGLISVMADALATAFHFWHYSFNPLFSGCRLILTLLSAWSMAARCP